MEKHFNIGQLGRHSSNRYTRNQSNLDVPQNLITCMAKENLS